MELPSGPHGERVSPFARILVPVDGSEASVEAAQLALRIAALHQLPVVTLFVVDDRTVDQMMTISSQAEETVRRELETKGYSYLEHIARMARDAGVECDRVVRRGLPHIEVVDVVQAYSIDLVVIGETRGHGPRRAFLGSLTEHIIEYVPCSVLVAKTA